MWLGSLGGCQSQFGHKHPKMSDHCIIIKCAFKDTKAHHQSFGGQKFKFPTLLFFPIFVFCCGALQVAFSQFIFLLTLQSSGVWYKISIEFFFLSSLIEIWFSQLLHFCYKYGHGHWKAILNYNVFPHWPQSVQVFLNELNKYYSQISFPRLAAGSKAWKY